MTEEKLISNLVLISFTCLWFIVLFMFGLTAIKQKTQAEAWVLKKRC